MNPLTKGNPLKNYLYCFSALFFYRCLLIALSFAQLPVPQQDDLQIDPNSLKNASPSELINFLQDFNQQKQKAGEDVHKSNNELPKSDLSDRNIIVKDSTQKDNIKNSLTGPQSVYGNNIFQNSQILQLAELSTPPPDYPIGVGDHIVVSLMGRGRF